MFRFSRTGFATILALACMALTVAAPARADLEKIRQSGVLKVAVYTDFAPFSMKDGGIDIDLADALSKKLGLKLTLLPFSAGENLGDDLRNMVWKGHYLGYGPADVLMHVPVDRMLMAQNDKVEIFAPYYRDTVKLVRSTAAVPRYDNLDSLAGKRIGVEKISLSGVLLLGEGEGKFRDSTRIFPSAIEALEQLKAGALDAVLANQSEIDFVLKADPAFQVHEVTFQRLPRQGWVVGMAVKKSEKELAKLLQTAISDLIASGEMARIFGKYNVRPVAP